MIRTPGSAPHPAWRVQCTWRNRSDLCSVPERWGALRTRRGSCSAAGACSPSGSGPPTSRRPTSSWMAGRWRRSVPGSAPGVPNSAASFTQPEDLYAATLIGLLGAVEAGITTVVDWSDVPGGTDFTDAALQAHRDAGLRTLFVRAVDVARDGGATAREVLGRLIDAAGPLTTIALGCEPGPTGMEGMTDHWVAARGLNL